MALCPRRGDVRLTLSAAISFLSQHGLQGSGSALECHRGSGKAGKTLCVLLVEGEVAGIVCKQTLEKIDGRGCGCCTVLSS